MESVGFEEAQCTPIYNQDRIASGNYACGIGAELAGPFAPSTEAPKVVPSVIQAMHAAFPPVQDEPNTVMQRNVVD